MSLNSLDKDRTIKIILYIVLVALIITLAILISMIIYYYISLEDTGGGE